MSRAQKRQKKPNVNDEQELRASTLELFFDLVFVFTITQLTALVEHDTSFPGVGKAVAIRVCMADQSGSAGHNIEAASARGWNGGFSDLRIGHP